MRENLKLRPRVDQSNSQEFNSFLEREKLPASANFTQHPINVFHLIKKHTLATNNLLLQLGEGKAKLIIFLFLKYFHWGR